MTFQEYIPLANRTLAETNYDQSFSLREHLLSGVLGETGEVIDILKKKFVYGKPVDGDKLIEELGDAVWYIACMPESSEEYEAHVPQFPCTTLNVSLKLLAVLTKTASELLIEEELMLEKNFLYVCWKRAVLSLGLTESEILTYNVEKLKKRYPDKYSNEHAINRADQL